MRFKNMEVCECDKCGDKETLSVDSPNQARWHDCERVTGDGKVQKFLLCQKHFDEYKDDMLTADKAFNLWLGGKQ